MSASFPEPKPGGRVKVELVLSNNVTKANLKNATGADTSKFAKKVNLANFKSNVLKLNIEKLKDVPGSLSSLKSKRDKLNIGKIRNFLNWFK